jgi:TonB-linked SusC/RagA family outer membrane protein
MRKLLFTLLLAWGALTCFAQTRVIKGKVTDNNGDPLPGATVTLKATQIRTVTNQNGLYTINLSTAPGNVLVFSYLGYQAQEVNIAGKLTTDVKLQPTTSNIAEVVVTALNISREKKSLGVAQQSINVDDMTEARAANIIDLLDGKVAGLQLTTSGQSTGSTRATIRGTSSITGNNQPLWVIDGVAIDNADGQSSDPSNPNSNTNQLDYGNGISALNPDDIQSIEVLKGPNAAALYGSRAANGAFLVTTKKGKKNAGVGVSVNENLMQGQILQFPDYQNIYGEGGSNTLSGARNAQFLTQEGINNRNWGGPMLGQPYVSFTGVPISYVPHPDNVTSLYQRAYALTQNFSISNASETPGVNGAPPLQSSIRFSYTRIDATDVMQLQNLQTKNNLAFNASKDFTNYLRIDTRIQYQQAYVKNRLARNEDPANPLNVYTNMLRNVGINDLIPWKDASGNEFGSGTGGLENPYWLINENGNQDNLNTIIGGITATIKLLPSLQFRGQVSSNMNWGGRQIFLQKGAANYSNGKTGFYSESQQNNQSWNYEGLFMYNKRFKNFSLQSNFGGNIRMTNNYINNSTITSLLGHSTLDLINLANNASIATTYERPVNSQTNSLYATASLGYKGYLYVDLTGRNDWSSALMAANRSYFFPGASTSFVFSDFFKIPQQIMSYGKLRAAIATVGNDPSPYQLLSLFGYNNSFNGSPLVTFDQTLKNSNLKPERTTSVEFGLELKFLHDRISFDGSVYNKNTTNQILQGSASPASGYANQIINAGSVSNKGIELSVNAIAVKTKNFSWNVSTNFSMNRNMVNSLNNGVTQFKLGQTLNTSVYAEVGQPIGVMRGEDFGRDANGNILIQPVNGIPYSTAAPFAAGTPLPIGYLGNFQPKALGSFGSTFTYKAFDLNFLLSAKFGGQIFSGTYWRANQNGVTSETLYLRDATELSQVILGESGQNIQADKTSLYGNAYPDAARAKGPMYQGYYPLVDSKGAFVYDANGLLIADLTRPNTYYPGPQTYYQQWNHFNSLMIFDASYIKLTQVIIGYTVPRAFISKTIFRSARIALVGRNLWTIVQHTPKGIDPESANSSGNVQGLESGGSLPYAYYGFDLKFSF